PVTFKTSLASINFTGGTTLGSGSLIVNGGSLNMVASQNNAAPTNTVLARTTLNAGSNQFRFEGFTQANASVLDLGTIVRQPTALANFAAIPGSGAVNIRGDVSISNGIIGGWATAQIAKNDNVYDWATVDTNRNIIPLPLA